MDEYYPLLPLSCYYVEFLRHEIVLHFNTLPDIPSNFLSFKVTFGSFDPILRDNGQFPSLYQAAPKDTSLALAYGLLDASFQMEVAGIGHHRWSQRTSVSITCDRRDGQEESLCSIYENDDNTSYIIYCTCKVMHYHKQGNSVNVIIFYYDTDFLNDVSYNTLQYLLTGKVWMTKITTASRHDVQIFHP